MAISISDKIVGDLLEENALNCTPEQFRAKTAIQKLAPMYEDTEYGDLWLAVLGMAIVDAVDYRPDTQNSFYAVDAFEYLSQDEIPACEVAGIDSRYVKRVLENTLEMQLGT
jgi:hypothetical protein